jgi:hypothetical protein
MCECDFCNENVRKLEVYDMYLQKSGNVYSLEAYTREEYVEKEINFCPMCGRKLKED